MVQQQQGGGGGGSQGGWLAPLTPEQQQIRALQRDPREVRAAQAKLAAKQREKAFALANLKAQLDREYEDAVKTLGNPKGDPDAYAPGVGGPFGVPVSWIGFGR